jgi:hypothetical protein
VRDTKLRNNRQNYCFVHFNPDLFFFWLDVDLRIFSNGLWFSRPACIFIFDSLKIHFFKDTSMLLQSLALDIWHFIVISTILKCIWGSS